MTFATPPDSDSAKPGPRLSIRSTRKRVPMWRDWRFWFVPVLVALLFYRIPGKEPVMFEGRCADAWLESGHEDMSRALHELGPAAVPVVMDRLRREHQHELLLQHYRAIWRNLPESCRGLFPQPKALWFDEWRACNALTAIGPCAIPQVAEALREGKPVVRRVAAQNLAFWAARGIIVTSTVPILERALQDSEPKVRQLATGALERSARGKTYFGSAVSPVTGAAANSR